MKLSILAVGLVFAGGSALAQNAAAPSAKDFADKVAISDMFEIGSSQVAQVKGDANEKTFAAQMIHDHTQTSTELKKIVADGNLGFSLPAALDTAHQKKLHKLDQLKGAKFSHAYDADQVAAHKDAIALFESYSQGGDNPALKQWATTTLPALTHHLQMAEDLGKK